MNRKLLSGLLVVPALGAAALILRPLVTAGSASPEESAAVLDCPEVIDIGPRERGESVAVTIPLMNRGGSELIVSEVHSNCSCTVVGRAGERGRPQPFAVEPGGAATLVVRVRVDGRIGERRTFPFSLRTNDPERPKVGIAVVASEVRGGVFASPSDVAFGVVARGEIVRRTIDVLDDAPVLRNVRRAESSNPRLVSVKLLPADSPPTVPTTHPAVVLARLEVTVATEDLGDVRESVALFGDGQAGPWTVVNVAGRVGASVECAPPKLVLPQVSSTGPVYVGRCLLRSPLNVPFAVTGHSAPPGIAVEMAANSSGPTIARIAWDAKAGAALAGTTADVAFQVDINGVVSQVRLPVRCVAETPE